MLRRSVPIVALAGLIVASAGARPTLPAKTAPVRTPQVPLPQVPKGIGERKVSLPLAVKPVGDLLADLGRLSDVRLRCARGFERDIVAVSVTDRPLRELLERIALATEAEWRPVKEELVLTRTNETVARQERAGQSRRAQAIREGLAKLQDDLGKLPRWSPAEAEKLGDEYLQALRAFDVQAMGETMRRLERLDRRTPIAELLRDLVSELNAEELVGVREKAPLVYASQPRGLLRPLSGKAGEALGRYRRTYVEWATLVRRRGIRNPSVKRGNFTTTYGVSRQLENIAFADENGSEAPLHVVLKITSSDGYLTAGVTSFTREGRRLDNHSEYILSGWQSRKARPIPASESPLDYPVRLDPVRTLSRALRREDISEELALLVRPDAHEPLSLQAGPMFEALARHGRRSLVALLDDAAFWVGPWPKGIARRPTEIVNAAEASGHAVIDQDDWLVVHPEDPAKTRRERMLRKPAAAWLTRRLGGLPTADEWGEAAVALRPNFGKGHVRLVEQLMGDPGTNGGQSPEVVTAFGLLNPSERRAAATKQGLPVVRLSVEARRGLLELPLDNSFGVDYQPSAPGASDADRQAVELLRDRLNNGDLSERVLLIPGELPAGTVLRIERKTEPVVILPGMRQVEAFNSATEMLNFAEYARARARRDTLLPPSKSSVSQTYDTESVTLGKKEIVVLSLEVLPNVFLRMSFEVLVQRDRTVLKPDQLPAEAKAEMEKARREQTPRGASEPPPGAAS